MEEDTGSTRSVGWELPWSMRRHEKIGARSNDIRLNSSTFSIGLRWCIGEGRRGKHIGETARTRGGVSPAPEWGEGARRAPPPRESGVGWRAADSNRRWYPCCALKFKEL